MDVKALWNGCKTLWKRNLGKGILCGQAGEDWNGFT